MNRKKAESKKKKNFTLIGLHFYFQLFFYAIYAVVYLIIFPDAYGTGLHLNNWLFNNPEHLLSILQNPGKVLLSTGKLWAWKILLYILWTGFIASLFYLGWTIQNKKPEYHPQAVLRGREPYQKALQINEEIKAHEYNVTREVKTAVRNVMEYLRNESDFGIGDNSVIACEREIANCLKTIENNIPALCNTKTMGKTEKIIIENCKTILINLKLRTERKKTIKGGTGIMQHQVVELECPGCAAIITTGTKTCPYCFRPIVITSFNSISDFSSRDLNKQANVYKKAMEDHPDDGILNTSLAFCYLKLKLYDKAISCFDKALEDNLEDSEICFYAAVALLKGKKAFLTSRPVINKIEEYLNAAIMIEPREFIIIFGLI